MISEPRLPPVRTTVPLVRFSAGVSGGGATQREPTADKVLENPPG